MKKILYMIAMFSMAATMAACGNNSSDDDDSPSGPAYDGECMAKKICECTKLANEGKVEEATKCGEEAEKMARKHEKLYAKDTAATRKYAEAFSKYKCDEGDNDDNDEGFSSGLGFNADSFSDAARDGKRMGEKICECTKLANEGKMEEATKCGEEAEKMAKKHEKLYAKDTAATRKYAEAMLSVQCDE